MLENLEDAGITIPTETPIDADTGRLFQKAVSHLLMTSFRNGSREIRLEWALHLLGDFGFAGAGAVLFPEYLEQAMQMEGGRKQKEGITPEKEFDPSFRLSVLSPFGINNSEGYLYTAYFADCLAADALALNMPHYTRPLRASTLKRSRAFRAAAGGVFFTGVTTGFMIQSYLMTLLEEGGESGEDGEDDDTSEKT